MLTPFRVPGSPLPAQTSAAISSSPSHGRGRHGNVHILNDHHNPRGGQIHGVGEDIALIAESCAYHESMSIWTGMGNPRGWKGIGNEGTGASMISLSSRATRIDETPSQSAKVGVHGASMFSTV